VVFPVSEINILADLVLLSMVILTGPYFNVEQFSDSGVNILRWDYDVGVISVFIKDVAWRYCG